jgi:hypothetical protein
LFVGRLGSVEGDNDSDVGVVLVAVDGSDVDIINSGDVDWFESYGSEDSAAGQGG